MQQLLIGVIFVVAVAYLFRMVRAQFRLSKDGGCAKGCGTCTPADVKKTAGRPPGTAAPR